MTFDTGVLTANWQSFAQGLATTIAICCVSIPVGFAAGVALAFLRLRGGRMLNAIGASYVEVIRNVPFLIQAFLLFFVLPFAGIRLDPVVAGSIALACCAAAYSCEIVRGAIATIPAGQHEAARALGLSHGLTFRQILLPQVAGYILPASGSLAITLIKESAVLSVITVRELTYASQDVVGRTFAPVEVFTLVAILYWLLTAAVAAATQWLEQRVQPGKPLAKPHRSPAPRGARTSMET